MDVDVEEAVRFFADGARAMAAMGEAALLTAAVEELRRGNAESASQVKACMARLGERLANHLIGD